MVFNEKCLYHHIWNSGYLFRQGFIDYYFSNSIGWQLGTFCFPEGGAIPHIFGFVGAKVGKLNIKKQN